MILIDDREVKFGKFPNGESNLNFNQLQFASKSVVTLKYESDQDLFNLYILKNYIGVKYDGCWSLTLRILYMPYSRMDRANRFYTFNLQYVCQFINSLNFHEVEVYDAHSDVTLALLQNVSSRTIIPELFKKFINDLPRINVGGDPRITMPDTSNLVVMYPDAGAEKRYGGSINYPTVIGNKERDFATGAITKFNFYGGSVEGKDVVIIDDLCSKGGTFVGAAIALREAGALKVYLIVAHCENTILEGGVFSHIDKVYTTNSILITSLIRNSYPEDQFSITKLYEVTND